MPVRWNSPQIEVRVRAAAMRGVTVGIGIVEQRAVDLITGPPKTGRVYRRRGVVHQASAPGEAPASDTGTLVNARRIDLLTAELAARLTFTARHAPFLERGTKNIEPRPFAARALAETQDEVRGAIASEVRAALS